MKEKIAGKNLIEASMWCWCNADHAWEVSDPSEMGILISLLKDGHSFSNGGYIENGRYVGVKYLHNLSEKLEGKKVADVSAWIEKYRSGEVKESYNVNDIPKMPPLDSVTPKSRHGN